MLSQKEALRQKFAQADFTDDVMFGLIMSQPEICKRFLQAVLPAYDFDHIKVTPQKYLKASYVTRAGRLDLLCTNENGTQFNVELQMVDEHNLAKRSRYNYQFETAHILTTEYTTTMDGMSADVSGYATANANAKVRTYLDGEEVKPAEESDEDGYFSFEANKPGKWVVKVTKNGKTDSDYTIVKPSKKYKDKKAKKIKEKFANAFAQMADSLEEIGVDEYNRWSDADASGTGGSVDDLIAQVQKEHGTDSTVAMLGKYNLNDYLKQLKNLESTDYDTYSDYYSDMLSYYRTVMNPSAGYKDNFGDKFDDLRDKITNDFDEMGR